MSELEPLTVTLELPASEFMDGDDGGLYVRCPNHRGWVPLTDYYSEGQGSLLPLVGNAKCPGVDTHEHYDTGEKFFNPVTKKMEPLMAKRDVVHGCDWEETVRILPDNTPAPEGGTLNFNVHDSMKLGEKFGG